MAEDCGMKGLEVGIQIQGVVTEGQGTLLGGT